MHSFSECKRRKSTKLTRCNLCKRTRVLITRTQRRIRKRCVRRVYRRVVRCRGCPRRRRTYRRCLGNAVRLTVTTFNARVGCFRCVRRKIKRRSAIKCGRATKRVSRCSRVTRRKIITIKIPYARSCRCMVRVRRRSVVCSKLIILLILLILITARRKRLSNSYNDISF